MTQRVNLQSLITLSVLSVGILSGTVGLAYAYWHAKQSLQATVGITFQEIARQSAEKAALLLAKDLEWMRRFGEFPGVRESIRVEGPADQRYDWFERWREEQEGHFYSISIIKSSGQLVAGHTSEATRAFYARQSWWTVVFDEARPWTGPLAVDELGRGFWEIVVPIAREAGVVGGALKVAIGTDQLLSSIMTSRIGRTGHVMVLSDDGSVFACSFLHPKLHQGLPAVVLGHWDENGSTARMLQAETDTHGNHGGIIGVARVVMPRQIAQPHGWYILVQQDPEETFEPLASLVGKLAAFWIGAVGLVGWLRWRLAKRIVRPIAGLIRRVNLLGEPRSMKPVPMPAPCGIVEIDALAASFEELSRRLEQASTVKAQYVGRLEQANLDLATSEEHYRLLWNHSVDSKILVDSEGIIRDINRRGELKLGRPASAVLLRPVVELVVEADRARLLEQVRMVLQRGDEVPAGTMQVPTPSGELTMEIDLVPVRKSGRIESIMIQLSDLTEQKELQRQLLRSERLASLSQFASMFAHDIRNPLAGIKKTLEWLGRRPDMKQDAHQRCLEDLRFTTDLLLGMINDMLDVYQENYSGIPLSTSEVSVGALLNDVVHLFRSEADAQGVTIRLDRPHEDALILGDGRRLQRVLINLVHNALKYSPTQGTIFLTVLMDQGSGVSGADPVVVIQVEDEGPGIAPEDQPHLFEMFFRKKDGQDYRIGRGLGLHFCRLVVEAHGGLIRATNRREGGAKFTVELPLRQEQPCLSPS